MFSNTFFKQNPDLYKVWMDVPPHPLQAQEPTGDRQWIEKFELLQKLTKFEDSIGVKFNHIRLLARAFTDRSVGYTNLTLGSNQRLEFLGDTVLQLIASEYLYKYFPEHHEGHLSVSILRVYLITIYYLLSFVLFFSLTFFYNLQLNINLINSRNISL